MEVGRAHRDVAQRRDLEGAAQRSERNLLRQNRLEARPLAQAEIEGERVGVDRNRRVARRAERVIGEVGEQPVGRVLRVGFAGVAGEAVAALGVDEQRQPARLDRREPRLAAQIVVEFGGEGREALRGLVGEPDCETRWKAVFGSANASSPKIAIIIGA